MRSLRATCTTLVPAFVLSAVVPVAAQQSSSGWAAQFTAERSPVTDRGVDTVWSSQVFQVSFVREEKGGWFGSFERQARGGESDYVLSTSGYRRLGDWTLAGGVAGSADPAFWFRASAHAEVHRRVVGTLVASVGYRYLNYAVTTVHQVQPALTWYHRRGDLQGRVFITRNTETDRTSPTFLILANTDLHPRVRLLTAVAYGDRIFDVASLPEGTAEAWMARATLRVFFTKHDAIEVGGGGAHEEPDFTQRTVVVAYRRVF